MSNQNYIFTLSPDTFLPYSLKLRNVGSAKYGGDWHSTPHVHNYTELFYIVGGQGQFRIDDELFSVSADQLVIVNPNIAHTEVSYDAHPMEYIVIGIEGLELSVDRNSGGRFCIFSFPEDNHALTCMQHILQEMQTRNPHYQTLCQAYMEILVVQLMRDASFSGTSVSADPVNSRQCTMIRRYIDNHYKEPLTLDLLAEKANVNKYYLSHMYKEAYSISPISYMIACRIKEGKRLLADTDLPLSQISSILGFSSPSYFSQSFRKAEGVSPLEYRMAHQRKQ
jgi:AraC-like DNA-binding protein/mannose-6-phosphate isomerase-like protein (cupin superfamily)